MRSALRLREYLCWPFKVCPYEGSACLPRRRLSMALPHFVDLARPHTIEDFLWAYAIDTSQSIILSECRDWIRLRTINSGNRSRAIGPV